MFDPVDNRAAVHFIHAFYLFFVVILAGRTRAFIRDRYEIQATLTSEIVERCGLPEHIVPEGCDAAEDYIVAFLCMPCTISQVSRHTAPYDTYEGSCFSSTGMPPHAPSMV